MLIKKARMEEDSDEEKKEVERADINIIRNIINDFESHQTLARRKSDTPQEQLKLLKNIGKRCKVHHSKVRIHVQQSKWAERFSWPHHLRYKK